MALARRGTILKHGLKALLAAPVLAALLYGSQVAEAQPVSMVLLNGRATPVFYNDGDTFRPLGGPMRQRPARLGGFNTLESYGPAHRWGGWTFKELYVNAKVATLNARRGVWSCQADPNDRDGYGRVLADCPDLAADQVRKGLAHVFSVKGPGHPKLIEIQRDAIVNRRGMWAKGVPPLVMTSLHSADERYDNSRNYNRMISPLDGATTKWMHQNIFTECEEVCHEATVPSRAAALKVIAALRANPKTKSLVHGMEDLYLIAMLREYTTTGRVAEIFPDRGDKIVTPVLAQLKEQGLFGELKQVKGACMVHVLFQRRYKGKPDCLKW